MLTGQTDSVTMWPLRVAPNSIWRNKSRLKTTRMVKKWTEMESIVVVRVRLQLNGSRHANDTNLATRSSLDVCPRARAVEMSSFATCGPYNWMGIRINNWASDCAENCWFLQVGHFPLESCWFCGANSNKLPLARASCSRLITDRTLTHFKVASEWHFCLVHKRDLKFICHFARVALFVPACKVCSLELFRLWMARAAQFSIMSPARVWAREWAWSRASGRGLSNLIGFF